jgi:hypothetical protein
MALRRPSVEGPEFAKIVRQTNETVRRLEENRFDFKTVPELFAKDAAADVVAKEIVHVFDGKTMTRHGRLVMGGVGGHFNLMGPIPPNARLQITPLTILSDVNRQLKSKGLNDLPEYRKLGEAEEIEFYNYEIFYTLRDLVFWLVLHDAGSFPSSLEVMVRHIAAGNIVQSNQYSPRKPVRSRKKFALMAAGGLSVSFPTTVVEWMDKPIYGGLAPDTIHVETLLTTKKTDVSHPYLPLQREGKLTLKGKSYYYRRFTGVTPKDGLRGLNVKAENARDKY